MVNVSVLDCPRKTLWFASTSSIFTLCWPGGSPVMSTVLLSLASAHHQGKSSTVMCKCPIRGDALRAPSPNTGKMRRFSTRYWAQKTPAGWASPREAGRPRSAWVRALSRSQGTRKRRGCPSRSEGRALHRCQSIFGPGRRPHQLPLQLQTAIKHPFHKSTPLNAPVRNA